MKKDKREKRIYITCITRDELDGDIKDVYSKLLKQIPEDKKKKYYRFEIRASDTEFDLYGIRLETDKEYIVRKRWEEKCEKERENDNKKWKEEAEKADLKLYKKLKKKYGKLE